MLNWLKNALGKGTDEQQRVGITEPLPGWARRLIRMQAKELKQARAEIKALEEIVYFYEGGGRD